MKLLTISSADITSTIFALSNVKMTHFHDRKVTMHPGAPGHEYVSHEAGTRLRVSGMCQYLPCHVAGGVVSKEQMVNIRPRETVFVIIHQTLIYYIS